MMYRGWHSCWCSATQGRKRSSTMVYQLAWYTSALQLNTRKQVRHRKQQNGIHAITYVQRGAAGVRSDRPWLQGLPPPQADTGLRLHDKGLLRYTRHALMQTAVLPRQNVVMVFSQFILWHGSLIRKFCCRSNIHYQGVSSRLCHHH